MAKREQRMSIASRSRRPLLSLVSLTSLSSVYSGSRKALRVSGCFLPAAKTDNSAGSPGTVAVWINRSVIKLRRVCTCSVLARLNNQTITLLDFFHYHVGTGVVNARQAQQRSRPVIYDTLTYPVHGFSTDSRNHRKPDDTLEFLQVFVLRR